MRLVMMARAYCDGEECESYFDLELPVEVLPLNCGNEIKITLSPDLEVPECWYVHHRKLFCPQHHSNNKGVGGPTLEVLDRARKLQALAMDRGATEGERAAAWAAFGKIYEEYNLPVDFGFEEKIDE